ncbi:uncharacterized protein LTR77_001485 [Saxophila tyrrhenica]|uniref:Uncharacterized protein n=1 Tax=Saxophila tyrrhenica TaxID=1690608 RepID=A0AAV9PKY2_9PEZI|nr:hypothetical protein LTR77_001485 [Saxophila tyrrhenica]
MSFGSIFKSTSKKPNSSPEGAPPAKRMKYTPPNSERDALPPPPSLFRPRGQVLRRAKSMSHIHRPNAAYPPLSQQHPRPFLAHDWLGELYWVEPRPLPYSDDPFPYARSPRGGGRYERGNGEVPGYLRTICAEPRGGTVVPRVPSRYVDRRCERQPTREGSERASRNSGEEGLIESSAQLNAEDNLLRLARGMATLSMASPPSRLDLNSAPPIAHRPRPGEPGPSAPHIRHSKSIATLPTPPPSSRNLCEQPARPASPYNFSRPPTQQAPQTLQNYPGKGKTCIDSRSTASTPPPSHYPPAPSPPPNYPLPAVPVSSKPAPPPPDYYARARALAESRAEWHARYFPASTTAVSQEERRGDVSPFAQGVVRGSLGTGQGTAMRVLQTAAAGSPGVGGTGYGDVGGAVSPLSPTCTPAPTGQMNGTTQERSAEPSVSASSERVPHPRAASSIGTAATVPYADEGDGRVKTGRAAEAVPVTVDEAEAGYGMERQQWDSDLARHDGYEDEDEDEDGTPRATERDAVRIFLKALESDRD